MKPHVDDILESHPFMDIFIRNMQYHPISWFWGKERGELNIVFRVSFHVGHLSTRFQWKCRFHLEIHFECHMIFNVIVVTFLIKLLNIVILTYS